MKNIGVATTGGDAPGMNAAIRAVVRTAIYHHKRIFGIKRGFKGMVEGDIEEMNLSSVSGIINRGGTILKTIRAPEFKEIKTQKRAVENLKKFDIDGLIIIGGNGSLIAGDILYSRWQIPVVNIPASIDNDLCFTDYTIGFDTAVNTALEAIDKIRDTATSHDRIFIVEVMGRNNGQIALEVALTSGAEGVLIPEIKFDLNKICKTLIKGHQRGKKSSIIIVAEGVAKGIDVAKFIEKKTKLEVRVSILGYVQRGGAPTSFSRALALRLGKIAVELLISGKYSKMVGISGNKIITTDTKKVLRYKRKIRLEDYKLINILSI
ncbi:MAG: 6-phosphofructokinase [Candidatus Firestonebacteria bacterium]